MVHLVWWRANAQTADFKLFMMANLHFYINSVDKTKIVLLHFPPPPNAAPQFL